MSNATLTLIIIGVMCVMYIVDRFPVALVTLLGMLAMVYFNILPFKDAFSNFGSTPVLLTAGMVIIINGIIDSGVILRFEHVLQKLSRGGEKLFGTAVLLSAGIISMFTNNSALVVMFMPFIASLARSSKGKITKKHLYLPLAVGGLIGGTGTLAGSTAPRLTDMSYMNKTIYFFVLDECRKVERMLEKLHAAPWSGNVRIHVDERMVPEGYMCIRIFPAQATKERMLARLQEIVGAKNTVTFGSYKGRYDVYIENADKDLMVKELKRRFEPVSIAGWRNIIDVSHS